MKTLTAWDLSLGLFWGISFVSFRNENNPFASGAISNILYVTILSFYFIHTYIKILQNRKILLMQISWKQSNIHRVKMETKSRNVFLHHLPWFLHQCFLLLTKTHLSLFSLVVSHTVSGISIYDLSYVCIYTHIQDLTLLSIWQ